ncbi:MAG: flippase-like domain-containing protein [Anaerolineales bacterium]|nr:flippase-like domain-containing protein [Anaerolineales bacterium]
MSKFFARLQLALLERRTIQAIVWFVITGALLYLTAVFWFGWRDTMAAFAVLGPHSLLIGVLFSSTSYLWRFARWERSLQCLGYSLARFKHLGIYLSGLALTATPGKAGETFRSALLFQHGVRVTHSLAAFLVDRGSDVLGMILLGTLATIVAGHHSAWVWLLSFATLLLGSTGFAYLLLYSLASAGWRRFGRYMAWLPTKGGRAVLEAWANVWTLPRVSAFSVIAVIAYGTQAMLFAWFCHILNTGISSADCVLIFVQATLLGAASMIPGGLGAMEAALVFQLLERGVSDVNAMSLAIAIRLVTLWFGVLTGVVCLLFLSVKDLKSA